MDLDRLHNLCVAGDKEAERILFDRLSVSFRIFAQHRLWNIEDAEDVVQEALKTVAQKCADIKIESSFAAWARRILEHKILDSVKAKQRDKRKMETAIDDADLFVGSNPNPSFVTDLLACLRKVFGIDKRYARVLNLCQQGYTSDEICERLDVKVGHMYVLLSRARAALLSCLEGKRV